MSISQKIGIGALFFLYSLHGAITASIQGEQLSEAVMFTLYRVTKNEWGSKSTEFKTKVTDQANTFCRDSPSSCGLTYWNATVVYDMSSVIESAVADGKDLIVTFTIMHPSGANVSSASQTQFFLNKVATKNIFTNIRVDIEQVVGSYVTYVEEDYYGIPPDNLVNRALVPIAFIVLFAIIIVAVALHVWNKRKNKRERRKTKEIHSSKVTPIRKIQGAIGKNIDTHHNLKGSNVSNTDNDNHDMPKVAPPTELTQPPTSVNEFMEVDETQRNNATYKTLPPLADDADSEQRKDKKKKKRKRKKRHHRDSEDTGYDPNQSDTDRHRKHSSKSQEHYNSAFDDDDMVYDSDPIS